MPQPTICITLGDPAGIGPEVAVKALADPSLRRAARWVVVGEAWQMDAMGLAADETHVRVHAAQAIAPADVAPGRVSALCGQAALEYIRQATRMCLAGEAHAMVTAPICKAAVAQKIPGFVGHTEYLAELCGADESRILLVNDQLWVANVTAHCSLVEATTPTVERILTTIELAHAAMVRYGNSAPRVAVCGLNPHAGEAGLFGDEEERLITPAIDRARAAGIDCSGPYPADTLFVEAVRGRFDLVVAMYHDQGHVPMKLLDFENTVNVTLGLPIIRTSPAHGTAFDIAGKNLADSRHMQSAMRLALRLANA